jgi:hypothetical protein
MLGSTVDIETMAAMVVPTASFISTIMDNDLAANRCYWGLIEIKFTMNLSIG